MSNERLLNEWVIAGSRVQVLLLEEIFECQDSRPPVSCSRQEAVFLEVQRLLDSTPIPTKEQVLQWEAERLAERKAKE